MSVTATAARVDESALSLTSDVGALEFTSASRNLNYVAKNINSQFLHIDGPLETTAQSVWWALTIQLPPLVTQVIFRARGESNGPGDDFRVRVTVIDQDQAMTFADTASTQECTVTIPAGLGPQRWRIYFELDNVAVAATFHWLMARFVVLSAVP